MQQAIDQDPGEGQISRMPLGGDVFSPVRNGILAKSGIDSLLRHQQSGLLESIGISCTDSSDCKIDLVRSYPARIRTQRYHNS